MTEPEWPPRGESIAPDIPSVVAERYLDYVDQLKAFAVLLAGPGVERGLIGPREVLRLWERHIVNCAVVADVEEGVIPAESSVIDVGSGAGLPGLVWGITRPDLNVVLLEPMARRVEFLELAVAELGLSSRVIVERGRAESQNPLLAADVVTARAVAPLSKLAPWLLPLVHPGGQVVAFKGSSAEAEIAESSNAIRRARGADARIKLCGQEWLSEPTTVVIIDRIADPVSQAKKAGRAARKQAGLADRVSSSNRAAKDTDQ